MHSTQLLETIKVVDGKIINGSYHARRIEQSCQQLFEAKPTFCWRDIEKLVPSDLYGIWKFRLIYTTKIAHFEYLPYQMLIPKKWKLVKADDLDYSLKYENRDLINENRRQYENEADDIIFVKNGQITDSTYANLVFLDENTWWTPKFPLLKGTQRSKLLGDNKIKERIIRPEDLSKFSHFKLINALLEFDFPAQSIQLILPF